MYCGVCIPYHRTVMFTIQHAYQTKNLDLFWKHSAALCDDLFGTNIHHCSVYVAFIQPNAALSKQMSLSIKAKTKIRYLNGQN